MKTVFIILGPTSTGKTSLALKLCKKFNGEIISADSRQVVKYMDIGTGKIPGNVIPSANEESSEAFSLPVILNSFQDLPSDVIPAQAGIHPFPPVIPSEARQSHRASKLATSSYILDGISIWGYDLVDPNEYFSGYDYANFALTKSKQILQQDKTVFIVGGTGFYIDLITNRTKPALIEPNFELRKELNDMSLIQLQDALRGLNLEKFEKIDKNNKVRLIRAIEIAKNHASRHSGNASSVIRNPSPRHPKPLPYLESVGFTYIGLTAPREILYKNVDNWLENAWKNGLEEEVSNLLKGPHAQSSKLKGLVYSETVSYLRGEISKEEAIQKSKFALHAYIKRQLTWFNKNKNIIWFDITQDNFEQNIYNFING